MFSPSHGFGSRSVSTFFHAGVPVTGDDIPHRLLQRINQLRVGLRLEHLVGLDGHADRALAGERGVDRQGRDVRANGSGIVAVVGLVVHMHAVGVEVQNAGVTLKRSGVERRLRPTCLDVVRLYPLAKLLDEVVLAAAGRSGVVAFDEVLTEPQTAAELDTVVVLAAGGGEQLLQPFEWDVAGEAVADVVDAQVLLLAIGWHALPQAEDRVFLATLSIDGKAEPLQVGRVVVTEDSDDSAEIVYPDGTYVEILGSSKVVVEQDADGRKRLRVVEGAIQADVAPQPAGRAMMISTPTATLEVLGTSFGVGARQDSTQLDVASGRVSMTRKSDGQRIEVAAGQFAKASKSADESLSPMPLPKLPDTWSEDFANGLPSGWHAGKLISNERGNAVRAAPDDQGKENNVAVTTHNAWREGQHALAQLHSDSVLNVRFRQDAPAPLRIMLVTRAYPREDGRFGKNFFYENDSWTADLPSGPWRTISIPLSEASYTKKRGNIESGPEPVDGLAVFMLQVTTLEQDVGLTVDRIWISRE